MAQQERREQPPSLVGKPASPFEEIEALRAPLHERARDLVVADFMVEQVLAAADAVKTAYETAAEMELGASGFDNMDSMRRYGGAAERILAAAREVAAACKALLQ